MKQYVIDELRPQDHQRLKDYLDQNLEAAHLPGIYWLPLDERVCNDLQARHTDCRPHFLTLTLEADHLACELLVRTRRKLRCECMGFATEAQRNWLIRYIDAVFDHLGLVA
jgi:hypothetical protein